MIVRAGYRVGEDVVEDTAEGPDYEAAKAALPVRDEQRIWISIDR
ncbi:hypothetical protein SCB71_06230 [Herbiconiux sp. KACC 21604]|nr:hypothetical protein [Herbiconiux sp. SALV-R1]WPO87835.1 hypothetical protein SCB71_06230 [Herbiconiux sp. KACC 21604]